MNIQDATPSLVSQLYARAASLDRQWAHAGLAYDFGSRMIEQVFSYMERNPELHPDNRAALAVGLLYGFWRLNAGRDARRHREAVLRGVRPALISLDAVPEWDPRHPTAGIYAPLAYDRCAGELGRAVAQALVDDGMEVEWAWAYVWREGGCEWDEVAYLMERRFGRAVTLDGLRKWASRHMVAIRARVRDLFRVARADHPDAPAGSHCAQPAVQSAGSRGCPQR